LKKVAAGITMNWERDPGFKENTPGGWKFCLNGNYVAMLERGGVVPLGMLPGGGPGDLLDAVDFLVLTGGGDPDPALYGVEVDGAVDVMRERPSWEMELYRTARRAGIPVLGICMGLQIVGIAEGSRLVQDIASRVENPLNHHGKPGFPEFHPVTLIRGTALHRFLGDSVTVGSFHHQALETVPAGFHVAGYSDDGVIEAMESDDGMVLAVQWHPERDSTGDAVLEAVLGIVKGAGS